MLDGPSARTCSFLKKATTPNTEPVRRWHSPQWQTPTTSGSADTSTRKAPQQQCAVLVIVPLPYPGTARLQEGGCQSDRNRSVDPPISVKPSSYIHPEHPQDEPSREHI